MTKSMAKELGQKGIRVNLIEAGFIETDMTKGITQEIKSKLLSSIILQRFGTPEEVAHAVDFVVSNEYITGQIIKIDGGLHL